MGKLYEARFNDGTSRTVASFGIGRAELFYELTRVAEGFVQMPSGIADDQGTDEHAVQADLFLPFFERFWEIGWLAEKRGGFLYPWAQYAAGIIENITLQPRDWIDRNGETLEVMRFRRWEEFVERQAAKGLHISARPSRPPKSSP